MSADAIMSERVWWWIRAAITSAAIALIQLTYNPIGNLGVIWGLLICFGAGLVAAALLDLVRWSYRQAADHDKKRAR